MSRDRTHLIVDGLGVNPRVAGLAPAIAIVVGGLGIVMNTVYSGGDLRAGVLPWAMVIAVACLALCALGMINVHRGDTNWFVVVGGWWCVAAFAGIAGFFATIGIGTLVGIEEADVPELLTLLPVMTMAFGLFSMTPATALFAFGATTARVIPGWGIVAMWVAAPLLPVLLILGGLADGTTGTVVLGAMLGLFATAWMLVGLASRASARHP